MRSTTTVVLPEPAPATMSSGLLTLANTARCCSSLRSGDGLLELLLCTTKHISRWQAVPSYSRPCVQICSIRHIRQNVSGRQWRGTRVCLRLVTSSFVHHHGWCRAHAQHRTQIHLLACMLPKRATTRSGQHTSRILLALACHAITIWVLHNHIVIRRLRN